MSVATSDDEFKILLPTIWIEIPIWRYIFYQVEKEMRQTLSSRASLLFFILSEGVEPKTVGKKKKVLLLKWCKIQIKCSFIAGHTSKFSSKRSVQPQRDRVTAVFVPQRLHSMQEFDKVRQNKCILSRLGWLLLSICCITVSWFSQEEKSAFRRCTSALCSISPFKRGPSFKRIFDLRA